MNVIKNNKKNGIIDWKKGENDAMQNWAFLRRLNIYIIYIYLVII